MDERQVELVYKLVEVVRSAYNEDTGSSILSELCEYADAVGDEFSIEFLTYEYSRDERT